MLGRVRLFRTALVFVALLALVCAPAGVLGAPSRIQKPLVVVGSKRFTEQYIVGHLVAELAQAAGYPVERKLGLGGTVVVHEALVRGEINVYVEYTGTGLLAQLKEAVRTDPEEVYKIVHDEYLRRWGLVWLKPWGFNNTYALAMREDMARRLGIRRISDLRGKASELVLGATHEFIARPDGLPGLERTYGIKFKEVRGMDPGLMYPAVAAGHVDIISAFATDGRIAALKLYILEDDLRFFPPYYAAPVVRKDLVDRSPEIVLVLNRLAGKIDNATMAKLNAEVDEKKREPQEVARQFLRDLRLLR